MTILWFRDRIIVSFLQKPVFVENPWYFAWKSIKSEWQAVSPFISISWFHNVSVLFSGRDQKCESPSSLSWGSKKILIISKLHCEESHDVSCHIFWSFDQFTTKNKCQVLNQEIIFWTRDQECESHTRFSTSSPSEDQKHQFAAEFSSLRRVTFSEH